MPILLIPERVRGLRLTRGLTQAELAARAGLARITVHRVEAGKVTGLAFDQWERLADALGVDPFSLVQRTPAAGRGRRG